jgi:hypothetical protein
MSRIEQLALNAAHSWAAGFAQREGDGRDAGERDQRRQATTAQAAIVARRASVRRVQPAGNRGAGRADSR